MSSMLSINRFLLFLVTIVNCVFSQDTPAFLPSPKQVVVVRGSTAVLPCRVQHISFHKVIWSFQRQMLTFDTRRVADDRRLSVERPYQSEWNLRIADVKDEDAGTYSCQVNTSPLLSNDVQLRVVDKQPAPVLPSEVIALSGQDVEIPCKLPDVQDIGVWSFKAEERSDKTLVTEKDRFRFQKGQGQDAHIHNLVISDVTANDAGQYYCRARSETEAVTSLTVVVPQQPSDLTVRTESPNRLEVRWRRPQMRLAEVAGYALYVREHSTGKEDVVDVLPSGDQNGEESFTVDDLTAGATYTIQLASKLRLGSTVTLDRRSQEVNITTPQFIPDAPSWVKVKRLSDDEAEVQWAPPKEADTPGIIRGYTVTYALYDSKKMTRVGKEVTVQAGKPEGNRWSAILTGLRTKNRYEISVAGLTRKGPGRYSKPVIYLHKPMPPELSLNGRVLSESSVLLTVSAMGSGKIANVKLFYTEQSEPSWKSLDFQPDWKFTVVGGLDPHTTYFFKIRAKVDGKMKHSVTHISTPPYDLREPQTVQVSATASTSIHVRWDYIMANRSTSSSVPLGYVVLLEQTPDGDEDAGRTLRQVVVFNRTDVEVKDLTQGMRYNIMVAAFNGFGEGPRTDGLLFHIADADAQPDAGNKPPRFTHDLPERITVTTGEVVKITCAADGYPIPEVRWYEGKAPIGVAARGSNQLFMANLRRSTVLTCKATSQSGEIQASIHVTLTDDDTEEPSERVVQPGEPGSDLVLGIAPSNLQDTTFSLAWKVLAGDARDIGRYQIDVMDRTDRVLLTRSLPSETSSFNLHSLTPATEYRILLRAMAAGSSSDSPLTEVRTSVTTTRRSQAAPPTADRSGSRNSSDTPSDAGQRENPMTTTTKGPQPMVIQDPAYRARMAFTLADLTPTSVRLLWQFTGLDPRYVQAFDLKLMSRANVTLLTESLRPTVNEMTLNLHPGEAYTVQVRALDRRGQVLALTTVQLATPPALATTPPSPAPWPAERPGQTVAPEDTAEERRPPVLKRAALTLTTHAVTGDSARVDWTFSEVQESEIGQFVMKVKDAEDRTLLRQEMRAEARSLTLSNLTPRTRYVMELSALDDKGAALATTTASLTTDAITAKDEEEDDQKTLRVFTEELTPTSAKIAWYTPPKLLSDLRDVTITLTDVANVTLLTQQMTPLTRSLTVKNLQAGERYRALVKVTGSRGEVLRTGFLEFDTQATAGMPGRPDVIGVRAANNSAVRLDWRNTPSLSPAPGSDDINGYVINFAQVDADSQPSQGVFQIPVYGSARFVVIPNLRAGRRYMFQVASRNQYSFGPFSTPVYLNLPEQ